MNQQKNKTAVLLINLGTPKSPELKHVGSFLSGYLGDKRVISLPYLKRKLLVNGIIIPSRCKHAAKHYQWLWKQYNGKFPLVHYGYLTRDLLQKELGNEFNVYISMSCSEPTIEKSICSIIKEEYKKLIIIPLFPQYASSSTGICLEKSLTEIKKFNTIPQIITINSFYEQPLFIDAFCKRISSYHPEQYEILLLTYHSLPLNHMKRDKEYKNSCLKTSDLIIAKLNLSKTRTYTTFQSQMSDKWMGPFTDEFIIKKAKEGIKNILVVSPSFIADCLETSYELGLEYKKLFLDNGGENYQLVESLNDSSEWIYFLKNLVLKYHQA